MLNYLCTLSLKFDKKCYDAVQLSKSKKKAWQEQLYMIWYKSSLRERHSHREKKKKPRAKKLEGHIEKEFEKSWKKYLTNSKRCDIINKLSRKRGLDSKEKLLSETESWKLNNERPKETLENSEQSLNKAKLRIIKEVKKRLKNWKSVFRKLNRIDFKYCNRY